MRLNPVPSTLDHQNSGNNGIRKTMKVNLSSWTINDTHKGKAIPMLEDSYGKQSYTRWIIPRNKKKNKANLWLNWKTIKERRKLTLMSFSM